MTAPLPLLVGWQLSGRHAQVIGGGAMGEKRVGQLLAAGARVSLRADLLTPVLESLVASEKIVRTGGDVSPSEARGLPLEGVDFVVVCTDEPQLSEVVAARSREARVAVHAVDRPELCDIVFPALHREGPLQVAVSTAGTGPALAGRLRDHLARALPPGVGEALERFGRLRRAVRAVDPSPGAAHRRMGWLTSVARRWDWARLATLGSAEIDHAVERYRVGVEPPTPLANEESERPPVLLVGAGPGDPELLTVRARRALEEADLVVADRLLPSALLAPVRGELRIARKLPGRAAAAQAELEDWVVTAARAGRRVVRLKSGDPFVFGRGGEEVERFTRAGLEVEVVPGITSPQAAAAARELPTTLRGVARRLVILSGTDAAPDDLGAVAEVPPFEEGVTYALLMAAGRWRRLLPRLRQAGFPADLPAALIHRASSPEEAAVRTELSSLADAMERRELGSPAVIFLGEAVRHGRFAALEDELLQKATVA